MAGNFKKEDIRIIKTCRALITALPKLLSKCSFDKITVNDLCEEACLSRTAFYAHYQDKYDLLDQWLETIKTHLLKDGYELDVLSKNVNGYIRQNQKLITNLLSEANTETMQHVKKFMASMLGMSTRLESGRATEHDIFLSNFCVGGIINLLQWQIKNHFPSDRPFMTHKLHNALATLDIGEFVKCDK